MNNKKTPIIFIICYMAYTAIYIARLNLSQASPGMLEANLLDKAQVGMLGSVFSVVYAIGRLINGGISDRKAPWIMICTGLIITSVSNIIIGLFPPFIGILLLWGCNAFAQSMLWSSILRIVSHIYPEEAAKKKTSYMVTSVAAGNILGIVINTYIINKFGLRFAFIIPGAITLVLSTLVLLSTHGIKIDNNAVKEKKSMLDLFHDMRIKTILAPAMFHGMMKDNISLWMTVIFVDRYGINLTSSAYFVLFIPILGFVGRMIYPLCYKLCKENEHRVSIFGFIACALFSIPLIFELVPPVAAAVCLSLIYTAVSIINTSILSIFPIRFVYCGKVASVSGIMDFATYLGAGLSSLIYGVLIKYFGYSPMFISWALISVISAICLKKINYAD